jgi:transposase
VVKTDRKEARGMAHLIRMGWFRAVHAKSASSQEIRALLTARRLPLDKLRNVGLSLRGFGLKLGKVRRLRDVRTRARRQSPDAAAGHWIDAFGAGADHNMLHKALLKIVRRDEVCRQSMNMTAPGAGPIGAITYKTAVDDPHRIKKSKCRTAVRINP